MSLTSTADAAATSFCGTIGVTQPDAIAQWQKLFEEIATWITASGHATIPASAIVTTGSATTQTGPASPVTLSLS